ncbi:MAG: hypothetical protein AAGE01_00795 [Pseudomonadota bacterium]
MKRINTAAGVLAVTLAMGAQAAPEVFEVLAGNEEGLIAAFERAAAVPEAEIRVIRGVSGELEPFVFTRDLFELNPRGDTVLPRISSRVRVTPAPGDPGILLFDGSQLAAETRRFATIGFGGVLELRRARVSSFSTTDSGGAFRVDFNGRLIMSDCRLDANVSGGSGGVIFALNDASVSIDRCIIDQNLAVGSGGVLAVTERARARINNALFTVNAGAAGCVLSQDSRLDDDVVATAIRGSTFLSGCGTIFNSLIDNRDGVLAVQGSTLIAAADAINAVAPVRLYGNLLVGDVASKSICNGSDQIESLGFNLSTEESCALDQETDQSGAESGVEVRNGVPTLKQGSGAIDGASPELNAAIAQNLGGTGLPCGYKDARELGRPQDGNGDGVFECDIGDYEVQGGPDLVAAQSAAYFDPARPGEGVFLELLPDGRAFAGLFTYRPDTAGPAWAVGIGKTVGNSVVFDEMLEVTGGRFGPDLNPSEIERRTAAGMAMVFSDCEVDARQGKLAFQGSPDSAFPDLLVDATRLSTVVPCSGPAPANAGRSGSFFDPARDGEGIFVQWLSDGRVLVIWYTFDPEGNPLWIISGEVLVDGDRVRAQMLYPARSTRFGPDFDPGEIALESWGELVLEYTGCDTLRLDYQSTVPGFGAGGYDYQRITRLAGTSCP